MVELQDANTIFPSMCDTYDSLSPKRMFPSRSVA